MKKDVFKIDNYFITIGTIFVVLSILTIVVDPTAKLQFSEDGEGSKTTSENYYNEISKTNEVPDEILEMLKPSLPIKRLVMGGSGLVLLIIGFFVRNKENKIHSIWDALEKNKEARVRDLEVSLGLSRSFILDNLKHINAQLGAYYVYLSAKDKIVDGRLMEEHTLSVKCSGCGHAIKKKVSLANLEKPTCDYCGAPVPVAELSKLRKDVVNQFTWDNTSPKKELNLLIFIPLLIFFWPAAIGYLVYKKNLASQANIQKLSRFAEDVKRMNT